MTDTTYSPPKGAPVFRPGSPIITTDAPCDPQGGPIKAWSASVLKQFETCRYRVYLKNVKKLREPDSEAGNRGQEIHALAERYVKGELTELPNELGKFTHRFETLRELFLEGKVTCEEEWGFTVDWEPCGWMANNIWGRAKLDVFIQEDASSAVVIDYKTGKKFGNEIAHNQQAMIYAIVAFMRYPNLDYIRTEFWYLDHGDTTPKSYTREQAMVLMPRLKKRAIKLTSCQDFPPKPSRDNCRWCPYQESGACEWAYQP